MKYINYIAFLIIFSFYSLKSSATHLIGGDLIYTCLGGNNFRIEFILYQDCTNPIETSGAIAADNPLRWAIYSGNAVDSPTRALFFTSGVIDITDFDVIPVEFSNDCVSNIPRVCMRASRFSTVVNLPPNRGGYTILYQRCCRNQAVLNLMDPGNIGMTLFNYIPPFIDGQCSNNSPIFKNVPPQVICKDNPFRYDFSASDPDGDSLVYRLCSALPGGSVADPVPSGPSIRMPTNGLTYRAPLSAQNPVNAFPPIAIDPITGEMTGKPTAMGRFIVTVCVDEYRNGRKINTISRDVQFTVTDCSKNVIADVPNYPGFSDVADIQCKTYTVNFKNESLGGFNYIWYFGERNATSTDKDPTYTYSDTGTFTVKLIVNPGSSCPDSIEKKVLIYPYYTSEIDWEGGLCPGDTLTFTETSVNSLGGTYQRTWLIDSTEYTEKVVKYVSSEKGGPVSVKLFTENAYGCRDTNEIVIPVDTFGLNAGNDTTIVQGYRFSLSAKGAVRYQWLQPQWVVEPNNPNSPVNFPDTGVYELVVKGFTQNDCESLDTIIVRVVENPLMFLPNAFSPNGDGLNDLFKPNMVGYSLIKHFEVFNRYGQLVYKATNNNGAGWDGTFKGKPCDIGVYYYRVVAVAPENLGEYEIKGDVTLLR